MNNTSVGNETMNANGTWTILGPDANNVTVEGASGSAVIDLVQPGSRTYTCNGISGFNG